MAYNEAERTFKHDDHLDAVIPGIDGPRGIDLLEAAPV